MSALVGLMTFVAVIGIGLLILQPVMARHAENYMMRIRQTAPHVVADADKAPVQKNKAFLRLCKLLGRTAFRIMPALDSHATRQLLIEGGYRDPDHPAILAGIKVLCIIICWLLIVSSASSVQSLLPAIPITFFAWVLPNFTVHSRVKTRKRKIVLELPVYIDLVVVCAQAGLGLVTCLEKVYLEISETCPTLSQEFKQLFVDVKVFARPLRLALQDLAERCGIPELSALVSSLLIAEAKGADIATTLKQQSVALRDSTKRRAEATLSQAPVKMVPVIIFFILPLLFVPTLGPSILYLATNLMSMFQIAGQAH